MLITAGAADQKQYFNQGGYQYNPEYYKNVFILPQPYLGKSEKGDQRQRGCQVIQ